MKKLNIGKKNWEQISLFSEIQFFSINRKHTIAFCNKVIEEKLDITFMVETHLNNLDDEMIPLLRKAGLELVYVGVESVQVILF